MPRFDGTGPDGMGPMTGRGMGYCITRVSDVLPPGFRRGLRRYPYALPAVSLLYYLGKRRGWPAIGMGYRQGGGWGRRNRIGL